MPATKASCATPEPRRAELRPQGFTAERAASSKVFHGTWAGVTTEAVGGFGAGQESGMRLIDLDYVLKRSSSNRKVKKSESCEKQSIFIESTVSRSLVKHILPWKKEMTPAEEEVGPRREVMHAFINSSAVWLNEHLKSFIRQHVPDAVFIDDFDDFPAGADTVFQYCDGWALTQNFAAINVAKTGLINAYPNSDALARKDFLAAVVEYWAAKRPESNLRKHVPLTVRLTLDYAEYVDDALMAADDLSLLYSLEENEDKDAKDREWWILKPALVDCGAGIRLFSTMEELSSHLELAENETDDDDEEEESEGGEAVTEKEKANGHINFSPTLTTPGLESLDALVTTTNSLSLNGSSAKSENEPSSKKPVRAKKPQYVFKAGGRIPSAQMRAFVAQRYIVAIPPLDGRKWHVRSYALSIGRLKVHVAREMLALLAAEAYQPPWENPSLKSSLTNTALQDDDEMVAGESMRDFWAADGSAMFPDRPDWKTHVFDQICGITAELFRAAVHTMADKFTTLDKCFELFALDFLVDADGNAWLLEVNEAPAFYDQGVAGPMALRLMEAIICATMEHMGKADTADPKNAAIKDRLVEVLDETAKLGKSNITEIMPE
ncbi:tubulin-tyrosine ligase family-domain-containing protein [Chaetomium fimeti]|uniref:Tubulin-tyrosine ligase family-domain-containing protein n=1 Tax=Chaetomium fimeti TaxID=1854472 RepID=A0AAE0HDP7_9PEZI|nr:tubulin-tyrosine ligase family-domain-containing protein [Chaetomium fimeti]